MAPETSGPFHTTSFGKPVREISMPVVSLGQSRSPTAWLFDQGYTMRDEGRGFWGTGS